jgi:titin
MKHSHRLSTLFTVFLLFAMTFMALPGQAAPPPNNYTVTNTSDYGSSDPVITGSLRWAMALANSDSGASRIIFDIDTTTDAGCSLGGPCTIQPVRALPFLNAGDTEIDGYTQTGASEAVGSGFAVIKIEIDGTNVTGHNGFNITSANNEIRGLVINRFGLWGIVIMNPVADNNVIAGNYIGTDTTGLVCPTMGNGESGVGIENGAGNNTIGGTTSADRNIISCNHLNGVDISDLLFSSGSTSGNQVIGNYIGDPNLGPPDQGNSGAGVFIGHGAFNNTVGGSAAGTKNIINGNGGDGIQLFGPNTTGNVIAGNYIGVNGNATVEVPNDNAGVNIIGGAHGNTVGGSTVDERNVISGNLNSGVRLAGPATHENVITGNYIGTDATGGFAIANAVAGVLIEDQAWGNTIGPVNLISGNYGPGILLKGSATLNIAKTNFIGTNAAGDSPLQNYYGVQIEGGASNNLIGGISLADANLISGNQYDGVEITGTGTDSNVILSNTIGANLSAQDNHVGQPASGNIISGNSYSGVWISGTGTSGNVVSANAIGIDGSGLLALPNDVGVSIGLGALNNTIGGNVTGSGNVISGNTQDGVRLWDADTTGNTISGNHIGVGGAGILAIPNLSNGVDISAGAHHNIIGGEEILERNVISGNSEYGVYLEDSSTDYNQVLGNFIGTDSTGTSAVANGYSGVSLQNGPQFNVIGGAVAGEGNVISGNSNNGVYIVNSGTDNNTISGNFIGLDATGTMDLGNNRDGILIQIGPQGNVIGGSSTAERNVISGNDDDGIYISDASSNVVEGNYIGTDAQGVSGIGNGYRGVRIWNGASDNTIGPNNRIAYNTFSGVGVETATTVGNVITQNSIHSNLMGGIGLFDGAHNGINAPIITSTTMSSVTIEGSVASCFFCTVEVFSNPIDEQQGRTYLGSVVTEADGSWSLTVPCISGDYLTATATDATDGTSEFSNVFTSTVRCLFLPLIMR